MESMNLNDNVDESNEELVRRLQIEQDERMAKEYY
jgi:hypothetical protein